jgi:hypothetical protein
MPSCFSFEAQQQTQPDNTPNSSSLAEGWHIQAHWLYNCFHPKYPQVLGGYFDFFNDLQFQFLEKVRNQSTFGFFLTVFRIKEPSVLIS